MNLSPAQFRYTLFRNLGSAVDRIIRNDAKLIKDKQLDPNSGDVNYYVLTHPHDTLLDALKTKTNPNPYNLPVTRTTVYAAPHIKNSPNPILINIPAFKGSLSEQDPLEPKKNSFKIRKHPSTYIIGYDIENQPYENDPTHPDYPAKLLSHQFYCNFDGHRIGIVFLTDVTFRAVDFVRFINKIVPDNLERYSVINPFTKKVTYYPELKTVRLYAHFSLIECGWILPSMRLKSEVEDFFGFLRRDYTPLIQERDKEWHGSVVMREASIPDPETKPSLKNKPPKMIRWKVYLEFCDSGNLIGKGVSLKDLGARIGINKVGNDHIAEMKKYLQTNPDDFCYYGIMDSVITAEAHLWHNNEAENKLGLKTERTRTAALSADVFKKIFEKMYRTEWKRFLGYESNIEMTIAHRAFVKYYFGGRNEAFQVGPLGPATYYDLRSAYPTALIMLPDYNLHNSMTYIGKDAALAVERMEKADGGPFQIAGIEVSFRFRENAHPIFPVRIDEPSDLPMVRQAYDTDGLIFPRTGHTTVTWPELWIARRKQYNGEDLLEELTIHSLVTFENLKTYNLSTEVYNLLSKRNKNDKAMDGFYKQILNYFYGKTAEGVRKSAKSFKQHDTEQFIQYSPVTCFPISSFITGFCRSAVGELLQYFNCYGITTDGFISPDSTIKDEVESTSADPEEKLHFCRKVQQKVGGLNPFVGVESEGDKSLFLKTRGYLITKGEKIQSKLARAGAQTPRVAKDPKSKDPQDLLKHEEEHIKATEAFLQIIQRGKCDKNSWRSLKNLRKHWRAEIDSLMDKIESASNHKRLVVNVNLPDAQFVNDADEDDYYKGKILPVKSLSRSAKSLPIKSTFPDAKVNLTFDMKRIPIDPTVKTFVWQGKFYEFVSFKTRPLDTASDFHLLRTLAKRTESHQAYLKKYGEQDLTAPRRVDQRQIINIMQIKPESLSPVEVDDISMYFPELHSHWSNQEIIRQAAIDKARQALKQLLDDCQPSTDEVEAKPLEADIEAMLKLGITAITKKEFDASKPTPGFMKPKQPHKFEEKLLEKGIDPLEAGYDQIYYPKLARWVKFQSGSAKIIEQLRKELGLPDYLPTQQPSSFIKIPSDNEHRSKFLARFGGGQKQRGFIPEEPAWMEIDDYHQMLDKFYDVTECTVDIDFSVKEAIRKCVVNFQDRTKRTHDLKRDIILAVKRETRKCFVEAKRKYSEDPSRSEPIPLFRPSGAYLDALAEKLIKFYDLCNEAGVAGAYEATEEQDKIIERKKSTRRL